MFRKEKQQEEFKEGIMYANLAFIVDMNNNYISNFALRCIHKEYVLGYIVVLNNKKYFRTIMESNERLFPYFDNVTEAEFGLSYSKDKNFVINANPVTSFGIIEPTTKEEIYNTLSKHSMNFKFLDDKKEEYGKLKLYK